jgi:hypothetical protein
MSSSGTEPRLTRQELAWELVEVFDELSVDRVNEMLAKNVPLETLEFIAAYADDFSEAHRIEEGVQRQIPNLLLLGYLLRVVEERLIGDDDSSDA